MLKADKLEVALAGLPEKLLVGVSGGMDSVTLLHALAVTGRRPVVLHFDHGWRAESADDASFVCALARKIGCKFLAGKSRKSSARKTENNARTDRYGFFSRAALRSGVQDLVLAHQAEDQVETFLLQLLRGAGAGGRGMETISHREGLTIHRPWLGIWRKDIRAYAKSHRLAWREDSTNADLRHRRNVIRQRVLPYLRRQISPQVAENLWRAAEIARGDGQWLDALCATETEGAELEVAQLKQGPVARQRRLVLRWLQSRDIRDVSFSDVEAVRGLAVNLNPAKVNLCGGKFARRRAGKIFIEPENSTHVGHQPSLPAKR